MRRSVVVCSVSFLVLLVTATVPGGALSLDTEIVLRAVGNGPCPPPSQASNCDLHPKKQTSSAFLGFDAPHGLGVDLNYIFSRSVTKPTDGRIKKSSRVIVTRPDGTRQVKKFGGRVVDGFYQLSPRLRFDGPLSADSVITFQINYKKMPPLEGDTIFFQMRFRPLGEGE